jgi:hypothetical protein
MVEQIYSSDHDLHAAFLCNRGGDVCIAFDDPVYVGSEAILIDADQRTVHAVLHQSQWLLGYVSQAMMQSFCQRPEALLTALRPDGSIYEMMAPISILPMQTGQA